MVANLLLLAHHLELEMVPADYKLRLSPLPKFSPDRKFKFRVKRIRNPIAGASPLNPRPLDAAQVLDSANLDSKRD